MKNDWSKHWKSSKQVRKQRKYRYNAPLHIKQKFLGAHLSKELEKKYNRRSLTVRKGDLVKVVRGQYKKHTGKVERVDVVRTRVFIAGIEITKKEGAKSLVPIHPSNLIILEPNLDDKRRLKNKEKVPKESKPAAEKKSESKQVKSLNEKKEKGIKTENKASKKSPKTTQTNKNKK